MKRACGAAGAVGRRAPAGRRGGMVGGSVLVEFTLLGGVAVLTLLAVVQLAVFLFQRNVVVTAVAEGARVGASLGRGPGAGRAAACELIRQAIGDRCDALHVTAVERGELIVVTADGSLPPLASGLPALRIRHVAVMHDEERLFPGPRPEDRRP